VAYPGFILGEEYQFNYILASHSYDISNKRVVMQV